MNRRIPQILGPLVLAGALAACHKHGNLADAMTTVQYQGVTVPLARPYADLRAFKDDYPRHLSREAVAIVEKALTNAMFGPRFSDQASLDRTLERLAFPGYGMFYANQLGAKLDPSLEMVYVEVPQRAKNRYIALERKPDGSFTVVADFVAPDKPELVRVRRGKDGLLEFETNTGATVLRKNAL